MARSGKPDCSHSFTKKKVSAKPIPDSNQRPAVAQKVRNFGTNFWMYDI